VLVALLLLLLLLRAFPSHMYGSKDEDGTIDGARDVTRDG
jgi:hypothetical protein